MNDLLLFVYHNYIVNLFLEIDVGMENKTVKLSTSQMGFLFDREESNIRRHVINVFNDGELECESNLQNLHVNGVKPPRSFLQT